MNMIAQRQPTYEFQVFDRNRWITMQAYGDEETAKQVAHTAIKNGRYEQVRVVATRPMRNNGFSSRVIFSRSVELASNATKLGGPLDSAPTCTNAHDVFGPVARVTLNRLFSQYCGEHRVTVSEVLHNRMLFRRLVERTNLVSAAVNQIARLQTRGEGHVKQRREAMAALAQGVADITDSLPHNISEKAAKAHFETLVGRIEGNEPSEDEKRALGSAMMDIIGLTPSLPGRMEQVAAFLAMEQQAVSEIADLYIADLLAARDFLQALLGAQPSIGQALIVMVKLAEGAAFEAQDSVLATDPDFMQFAKLLTQYFKQRKLPVARAQLIDRVVSELKRDAPLEGRDPAKNNALFRILVETIGRHHQLLFDPGLAMAITRRISRHMQISSQSYVMETRHVGALLKNPGTSIIYFATLLASSDNDTLRRALVTRISETIEGCIDLVDLMPGRISPKERLFRTKAIYEAIARTPLVPEWRAANLNMLDDMITAYAKETRLLEKLNDPRLTLRDRAFRLVRFCASGLLPEGRALDDIRLKVIAMLKRPSFDKELVNGILDPKQAREIQKSFYQALKEAGFESLSMNDSDGPEVPGVSTQVAPPTKTNRAQ